MNNKINLEAYKPAPTNSITTNLGDALSRAAGYASDVAGGLASTAIDGDFSSLISQQSAVQKQMMLVSMESNLQRTEHETKMAPVRNLRVA